MYSKKLERLAGGPLPAAVLSLFVASDDVGPEHDLMRLLSLAEVLETNKKLREFYAAEWDFNFLLLWTDDNSNYAGVYCSDELAPRVAILDHEENDIAPKYFGVESFQRARRQGAEQGLAWYELPTDYPVVSDDDYPLMQADRALGRAHRDLFLEDQARNQQAAHLALALIPPSDMALVQDLVFCSDMWVQERACHVIGRRRHEPAIDDLAKIALTGMHNGRVAALIALKSIGTLKSKAVLKEIAKEIDPRYQRYLR